MSEIRIEVFKGDYDNGDAYNRVLGYIAHKTYIGEYGFSCNTELSVVDQFRLSETHSINFSDRKIWHFIITFAEHWNYNSLLWIAINVSNIFAMGYQIFFGLDTDGHSPHLHFGVNAFSYHPDYPILDDERMHKKMSDIQKFLMKKYGMGVTLQFKGKGRKNV